MRGGKREGAGRPAGARNKRTREVEAAMGAVAEKILEIVPDAFVGDGVALLQVVYRDPTIPLEVRLDAAAKAAPFERPRLAATLVKDMTPSLPAPDIDRRIAELLTKGRTHASLG